MKVLVTGASGHTGARLVRRLLEDGRHQVRILTREPARISLEKRQRLEVVRGSLLMEADVDRAVRGCDAVIAMTHIRLAPPLLAAMKREGVRRIVLTSSTRRFTQFPEETARAVIEAEAAVEASGLDWTIIRPTMIYGADRDNNLTHLVRALRKWPAHPLPGGGRMRWQPVFTWDVVAALIAALERPETCTGRAITVAGPEPITYREMVGTILRVAGLRRVLVPVPLGAARLVARAWGAISARPRIRLDQIERLQEDKVFDISEARERLGFDPISFEEGIRRKLAGTV